MGDLRQADALLHVVRAFASPTLGAAPPPRREVQALEEELVLADLEIVERRLQKLGPGLKRKPTDAEQREHALLARVKGPLEEGVPLRAQEMTADKLDTFFQSMVLRVITLTNALLPQMKEQGFGRILTVASSGVFEPIANLALSNTLRGALVGWSKTLSSEVAGFGITSNLLLPGRIHTDRIDELDGANAKRLGKSVEEIREASVKSIPAGRLGTVEEFAAAGAFLCSVPASYITGTMLRVDGGAAKSN